MLEISRPLRFILLAACLGLGACSSLIDRQMSQVSGGIAEALRDQSDPKLVAESLPTLLMLTEGMIDEDSGASLRLSASELYSAYVLVQPDSLSDERREYLLLRSFEHARRAFCLYYEELCPIESVDFALWEKTLKDADDDDIAQIYTLAVSWLSVIEEQSSDWNRVAQLPRVRVLLETVLRLDDSYQSGLAHLYLGGLATLLPPALGGTPEVGRKHFERAIELSAGNNLMAKVVYAERYARLVFDRDLHHRLLGEVDAAPARAPGFTLINTLAKRRATELLADEDDYFL